MLALLEHFFELVADVEVVFDGLLAASGDDDDLVAAGGHGLFDAVLNDGLVDQREHLFGLGFGGGQKAGAQAGGGENGFADFHGGATVVVRASSFGGFGHGEPTIVPAGALVTGCRCSQRLKARVFPGSDRHA